MRSRTRAAALAALTPLLLAGCGQGKTAAPATPPTARTALPTTLVGNIEQLQPGSLTGQDIAVSQQRFGLALMAKVCGTTGPNTLISPASAADALGMLDASAAGKTAEAVSTLLHLPTWGPAVVSAVHDHRLAIAGLSKGRGDTLRTSNRVWPAADVKPTTSFLNDVRTAYGAQLRTLDFAGNPMAATDAINSQVAKDTDGLIPRLFDQPLDTDTSAVLTNALVLNAKWQEPFLLRQTTSQFATAAGSKQVWLMDAAKTEPYASAGRWQAAQIAYSSGTLEAVVILPPAGSPACTLPTAAQLTALTRVSTEQALDEGGGTSVALPQMHLDQTHDLLKTLGAMGLPINGDYSGLGGVHIGRVVQKDVMTVDQLGTVAAAATGVEVEASASAIPTHALSFDRPFLLLLEDVRTHTPLFLASIGDPSAS